MPTIAVTDQTLQQEVLEAELPVLVDFWAEWCGPCKAIAPVLEKLADEYAGRIVIAKCDVDRNPMVAQALRIQSIPTMMLFSGGRPVDAVQGALPEAQLRKFIEPHLAAPAPGGITIGVEALAAALEAKQPYTIVDIRAPVDYTRSHLRGALNIEASELPARLPELGARGPVVLVCRTGEQSKALAEELEGGPVHVMALEKGLLEWEGEGHPTYSTREEEALDAKGA
jgi:thioredoxin